jgi:hypothetical protein
VSAQYDGGAPNQQEPTFPFILPSNSPLFQAAPDISLISPQFRVPYILQSSLQIEREIAENTTLSIGTMFNHGVHILSGSAYDLNLMPLTGTTTYYMCPPNTTALPCNGPSYVLPTMDNGPARRRPHQSEPGRDQRTDQPGAELLQLLSSCSCNGACHADFRCRHRTRSPKV